MSVLLGVSAGFAPPIAAAQPLTAQSVRVDIITVTPSTPARGDTPQPLTVRLRLTNTTDQSLNSVTVQGERGNPISTQAALEAAIAKPEAADRSVVGSFDATKPVTAALGPRGTADVDYASTSEIPQSDGLCICQDRIYPLYFSVHDIAADGSDATIGAGQTYVPSFVEQPAPVQVSWVWPIIDRPHRLISDTAAPNVSPVFTDDELAYSVKDGRLYRILQVVTDVAKRAPMTLVIDPELIDELAVMSAGNYNVESNGKTVPGVGTAAATTWLEQLRSDLLANPGLDLDFTPFADPDVETLTRNGISWTNGLSQTAQDRVAAALGGRTPTSDVVWPVGEALSNDTLTAVVRQGARSVILSDSALPGGAKATPPLNQLAALQTPAGPVKAVITTKSIQRYAAPVLSVGGAGLSKLPELVAEVAIRAVEDGSSSHFVAIVPPRDLDPVPEVATRAIVDTAHTFWSTGLGLDAATATVTAADHGQLVPPAADGPTLSPRTIDAAQNLTKMVPALTTMLTNTDANVLLGSLPAAVQRAESSYWRTHRAEGDAFALDLSQRIAGIESGVHIVRPSTGTYTLASSNSPLPVTVQNDLPYTVTVRVNVTSANGRPGFTAQDLGRQTIPAGQKLTLHVPTHVERTGRFVVQAELLTPSGVPVGSPVYLSVHSTALGTIGVIITVVAAVVLALALVVRFARRWRHRGRGAEATVVADPVAVP